MTAKAKTFRNDQIRMRISTQEKALIKKSAKKAGKSMSDYLRGLAETERMGLTVDQPGYMVPAGSTGTVTVPNGDGTYTTYDGNGPVQG